jgi:hypothetical protein
MKNAFRKSTSQEVRDLAYEETLKQQWALAHRLANHYLDSEDADEAILGRQLELVMEGVEEGAPLPRRAFALMRKMRIE